MSANRLVLGLILLAILPACAMDDGGGQTPTVTMEQFSNHEQDMNRRLDDMSDQIAFLQEKLEQSPTATLEARLNTAVTELDQVKNASRTNGEQIGALQATQTDLAGRLQKQESAWERFLGDFRRQLDGLKGVFDSLISG